MDAISIDAGVHFGWMSRPGVRVYPTDHEGAADILRLCDRALFLVIKQLINMPGIRGSGTWTWIQ